MGADSFLWTGCVHPATAGGFHAVLDVKKPVTPMPVIKIVLKRVGMLIMFRYVPLFGCWRQNLFAIPANGTPAGCNVGRKHFFIFFPFRRNGLCKIPARDFNYY